MESKLSWPDHFELRGLKCCHLLILAPGKVQQPGHPHPAGLPKATGDLRRSVSQNKIELL